MKWLREFLLLPLLLSGCTLLQGVSDGTSGPVLLGLTPTTATVGTSGETLQESEVLLVVKPDGSGPVTVTPSGGSCTDNHDQTFNCDLPDVLGTKPWTVTVTGGQFTYLNDTSYLQSTGPRPYYGHLTLK